MCVFYQWGLVGYRGEGHQRNPLWNHFAPPPLPPPSAPSPPPPPSHSIYPRPEGNYKPGLFPLSNLFIIHVLTHAYEKTDDCTLRDGPLFWLCDWSCARTRLEVNVNGVIYHLIPIQAALPLVEITSASGSIITCQIELYIYIPPLRLDIRKKRTYQSFLKNCYFFNL